MHRPGRARLLIQSRVRRQVRPCRRAHHADHDKGRLSATTCASCLARPCRPPSAVGRGRAGPVTTTRVADEVCRYHGVDVGWTRPRRIGLYEARAQTTSIFAPRCRCGFVGPAVLSRSLDASRLLPGLIAALPVQAFAQSDPREKSRLRTCLNARSAPWAARASVMRTIIERRETGRSTNHRRRQGQRQDGAAGRSSCRDPAPPSRTCGPTSR